MDEDQARLEAEARRQRILNQANNRMDRISGFSKEEGNNNNDNENHKPNSSETNDTDDVNDDDTAAAVDAAADEQNDAVADAAAAAAAADDTEAEAEAASSKAATARKAKLAAMRRRRFKKPTTTATETTDDTDERALISEDKDTTTTTTTTTPSSDVTPTEKEAPALQTPSSMDSTDAAPTTTTTTSVSPDKQESEPASAEETSPANNNTSGKKYMGVAKMRRKMIKERAARNATSDDHDDDHADNTAASAITTAQAVANKVLSNKMKQRQKISLYSLPILMEAVVVLLLFAVGLQVGLEQSRVEYTTILVHNGLVFQQPGGGGVSRIVAFIPDKISAWKQQRNKKQNLLGPDTTATSNKMKPIGASGEDEFADDTLGGDDDDDEDKAENIDPLFGIDLDKLTQGPGLVLFLGRFAVAAHRVNLYLFYYLPITIYTSIASRLWSFWEEPPLLCLAALLIRQFIGKRVLGARIPQEAQIKGHDADENTTDILGTIKKVVMTFITNAFPTLVTMAEGWMHLRSDMYVVLFGLFVGWAWHHTNFAAVGDYLTTVAGDGTEDIHPAATTTTTPITDGATDEL